MEDRERWTSTYWWDGERLGQGGAEPLLGKGQTPVLRHWGKGRGWHWGAAPSPPPAPRLGLGGGMRTLPQPRVGGDTLGCCD